MMRWVRGLLAGCAALLASTAASAQDLPFQGPIKIVAGFAAGGQTDVLARLIADKMGTALKRSVIVENRLGAGGGLAAETVKNATPDGSSILISNIVVMSLAPLSTPDLRYDAGRDFAPILQVGEYQLALAASPSTGARSLPELMAWLKENPDKANYGVPAAGSLPHLYGVALSDASSLRLTMVPYRGGPPITTALAGGHLAMGLAGIGDFAEQHIGGAVRVVAVSGTARNPVLRDVPTFAELGYQGFEENGWNGLFAPTGTPPAILALYGKIVTEALGDAEVRRKLEAIGLNVVVRSGPELADRIPVERERWRPIVKRLNLGP